MRNPHSIGIDKTRRPMKRLDSIGSHLLFSATAFLSRDVFLVAHEIGHGRLAPKREIDAEELARAQSRQGQGGFAQGLARDRAGVDPGTTNVAQFFDESDALAEDPCGIRPANAGWSAADHYYVEVLGHRHVESWRVMPEFIAVMLGVNAQRSFGEPRTRLRIGCFRKKLYRSFAKSCACERQHLC